MIGSHSVIGLPVQQYLPGVAVSGALALAAMVVSSRYGAPAMLMGLLLGMACHFVSDIKRMRLGLDLMAGPALRFGVALLALRLTFADLV